MQWKKFIPLLILVVGLVLFFYVGGHHYLSFETLKTHRKILLSWTSAHPVVSGLSFFAVYTLMVGFSIPNASLLTLLGGFLFGPVLGTIYVAVSATLGATLIFIAAKTAFRDLFKAKAGTFLTKMKKGFQKNTVSYLLFLRLVPAFPFWLINIVPAFFDVSLKTYIWTTFVGIIPGTIVYILLGNGLGVIIDQGKTPDMSIIFNPEILLPIIGLAVLALVPIVYKKLKRNPSA